MFRRKIASMAALARLTLAALALPAPARSEPVAEIAPQRLIVSGGAELPLHVSRDWSIPRPEIERAVILQHGVRRDAGDYFQTALAAQAAAGEAGRNALLIAPQFLDQEDVAAFHLPDDILRFTPEGWEGGEAAIGPKPLSSFDALDAILARLADRRLFPNLKTVVVAGHSGGGQVVQRYAIAGKGGDALAAAGVTLRYVVANPSSFAYFSKDRPEPAIAAACPKFDDWKYGMERLPPYVAKSPAELERDYVSRNVIYLLGAKDADPNHRVLDKSCMGEAEGPTRWARGHAYVAYIRARDAGAPKHTLYEIAGVGHDARKMFESACGLKALFDASGCD